MLIENNNGNRNDNDSENSVAKRSERMTIIIIRRKIITIISRGKAKITKVRRFGRKNNDNKCSLFSSGNNSFYIEITKKEKKKVLIIAKIQKKKPKTRT